MYKYDEYITELKVNDIYKNVLNKSRDIGKTTKEYLVKVHKIGTREYKQTLVALDIVTKKMLKGREISEKEKEFVKHQAKNIVKIIPLIALQGVPGGTVALTPLLIALGKKYKFDIFPKENKNLDDEKI